MSTMASDPLDELLASQDAAAFFYGNMEAIFAHEMQEVVECPEELSADVLKTIRETLYIQVQAAFLICDGQQLWVRRKVKLLATDIFILRLCLVSKAEDKRLKGIIRRCSTPDADLHNVQNASLIDASQNSPSLLELCPSLKEELDTLRSDYKDMERRMNCIEENNILLNLKYPLSVIHRIVSLKMIVRRVQ